MGWAFGTNNNGREIGYGVEAVCDLEGCSNKIDRGLAFLCGQPEHAFDNAGMDDEPYCGGYFCASHLSFVPVMEGYYDGASGLFVCPACHERNVCPKCHGEGMVNVTPGGTGMVEADPCDFCDTYGYVAIPGNIKEELFSGA